ncbi:MAG: hypothetical protein GY869_07190, partial [Planctomycetes bacterium]|nr:hypothetical protein [Planctomycetota bacterium]
MPFRGLRSTMAPGALVILLLGFLLLVAIFHKKEGLGRRVGIVALLVVVLLMGTVFLKVNSNISHTPFQKFEISYQSQQSDFSKTPAIWSVGVDETFSADIYPSKVSAVRSLGYEVAARIQKLRPHIITETETDSAVAELIQDQRTQKIMTGLGQVVRDSIADKKVNFELDEFVANIPVDRLFSMAMQSSVQSSNELVIKLVQDENERYLMEVFRESIIDVIDDCRCEIVRRSRNVDTGSNQIGVSLDIGAIEQNSP